MINSTIMQRFVDIAAEKLTGDWIVIGGAVSQLVGIDQRVTMDIDIASVHDTSQQQVVKVMEIIQELNLPVEAINQAAAFFLQQIPSWRQRLILVKHGKGADLYRPNLSLFFELKTCRLSQVDVDDCIRYMDFSLAHKEDFAPAALLDICDALLMKENSEEKQKRLLFLKSEIQKRGMSS